MIQRLSSRTATLATYLTTRLQGANRYDRIAGYFCSSLLQVAGEAYHQVSGQIRVVCNGRLNDYDARNGYAAQMALRQQWQEFVPAHILAPADGVTSQRLTQLYELLVSERLVVRIVPDRAFGMMHGKAGVIYYPHQPACTFLGSVNETMAGWSQNYEMLWEDQSADGVAWVQQEFEALWLAGQEFPLPPEIIVDIGRLAKRRVISVQDWRDNLHRDPASVIVESPIQRIDVGLWEHQKFFIKKVYEDHIGPHRQARYILADQVGLGKTLQLGLAAKLIALLDDAPILIICPRTLTKQWQNELSEKMGVPSAIWEANCWYDEQDRALRVPITQCPRRVGIVSQGLITNTTTNVVTQLLDLRYACVIVDESHRARRRDITDGRRLADAPPNKLLDFVQKIAVRTTTMLLATATPVQIDPIEAWDLLHALAQNAPHVLGSEYSRWQCDIEQLSRGEKQRIRDWFPEYISQHNPIIQHIVRRSRDQLEREINPQTGQPYLKRIEVRLLGERDSEAISLPIHLKKAYECAEIYTHHLGKRMHGAGFIKTLLLRRMGSSIAAGRQTVDRLLARDDRAFVDDDDDFERGDYAVLTVMSDAERHALEACREHLLANHDQDPKAARVVDLLRGQRWLAQGVIIFSQYYDTVAWLADFLKDAFPSERVAVYAGGGRSGVWHAGVWQSLGRDDVKRMVQRGEIGMLVGTDAASEGLNLQRMGCLINLDLPWNPTRLEQRKGRIQRIGQLRDVVDIYNMRYRDSVEDRVHTLLSERLKHIYDLFGQIPDVLSDVWIDMALGAQSEAEALLSRLPQYHPFVRKYTAVTPIDWDSCAVVVDDEDARRVLGRGW
ncbi:MAG: phospholipase D-like domain-containing protein [Chloroflexaceae bacterium]|nr:phospholipase D-like domain-containing protein [Chloroflexaceae bacterium]